MLNNNKGEFDIFYPVMIVALIIAMPFIIKFCYFIQPMIDGISNIYSNYFNSVIEGN